MKSASGAWSVSEKSNGRDPERTSFHHRPIVPEYSTLIDALEPWLIPATTMSGIRSSIWCIDSLTQSTGVLSRLIELCSVIVIEARDVNRSVYSDCHRLPAAGASGHTATTSPYGSSLSINTWSPDAW